MAWKRSTTGTPYYSRSRRHGHRVITEYIGMDHLAAQVAALDTAVRAERRALTAADRAERDRLTALDTPVERLCLAAAALLAATLTAAGYHRPNRGPWRRRRNSTPNIGGTTPMSQPLPTPTRDEMEDLMTRAAQRDPLALQTIRDLFDQRPELWRALGDLAARAQSALLDVIAQRHPIARAALDRHLATLRAALAGPDPAPLETLLIDRVIACWLQLHHADQEYARRYDLLNLKQSDYYQRRQSRAQQRYLDAIRALMQYRRIGQPTIQVNLSNPPINPPPAANP